MALKENLWISQDSYYSRKDAKHAKHAKKLLIFLNKVIDSTRDAILHEGFTEIQ